MRLIAIEELKKLAEIAGVNLDKEDWSNNFIVWDDQELEYSIWQPHIRIEQAWLLMDKMVEDGAAPALVTMITASGLSCLLDSNQQKVDLDNMYGLLRMRQFGRTRQHSQSATQHSR